MSGCPSQTELNKLLNDKLSLSKRQRLDQHLAGCTDCRNQLDRLTDFDSHQSAVPTDPSPDQPELNDEDRKQIEDVIRTASQRHALSDEDTAATLNTETKQIPNTTPFTLEATDRKYKVLESIGRGATGTVFRALDEQLNRTVALKVLHPNLIHNSEARQRLNQEARALANLSHPHIVDLYEFQVPENGSPFLVMEHIEGESVQQRLSRSGSVAPKTAARIVSSIASALQHAHQQGMIHRDVKSSNILLSEPHFARITDFGLARVIDQDSQLTQEGMIAGTPAYMSPEQIVDPSSVDACSDVYSLGIVLYELLTATLPFRGTTRMTLRQVENDDPRPPRELNDMIPLDLQVICQKAIEKQPHDRYATAAEFEAELNRFSAGKPINAKPAGRLERVVKWYRRNPRVGFLWSSIAALFLLATAISWVSAYRVSSANAMLKATEQQSRINATSATKQRDIALATIRKLIVDVHGAVEELPADTTDVEQLVSRIAMDGLRQMQEAGDFDPASDIHAARGRYQLGATLLQVGELDEAEQHLQTALDIGTRLLKTKPQDEECNMTVIDTLWSLSSVDQDAEEYDDALAHMVAALSVCQNWQNLQRGPDNSNQTRVIEVQCRTYLAEAMYDADQPKSETRQELTTADQILTQLEVEEPDSDLLFFIRENLLDIQDLVDGNYENQKRKNHRATQAGLDAAIAEAAVFNEQGNVDGEESSLLDALEMMDEMDPDGFAVKFKDHRIQSALRLANIMTDQDYPDLARDYFIEVVNQFDPESDADQAEFYYSAQLGIAHSFTQQGRLKKSKREFLAFANELIEAIGTETPTKIERRYLRECLEGLFDLNGTDPAELIQINDNPELATWVSTETTKLLQAAE